MIREHIDSLSRNLYYRLFVIQKDLSKFYNRETIGKNLIIFLFIILFIKKINAINKERIAFNYKIVFQR